MPQLSIDALNPSGTKAWRLQANHSWRKIQFAEPLQADDFTTDDPATARNWLQGRLEKDWRGRVSWEASPGRTTFAPGEISLHAIAHRQEGPSLPDREALRGCIAQAPTDQRRVLCLNLNGQFLLRDPERDPPTGDPALAAHGDSLFGPDYLGAPAAENAAYVDETYRRFLDAWYQHLRSGRVNIYAGEPNWDLDAADLRDRIRGWQPQG